MSLINFEIGSFRFFNHDSIVAMGRDRIQSKYNYIRNPFQSPFAIRIKLLELVNLRLIT